MLPVVLMLPACSRMPWNNPSPAPVQSKVAGNAYGAYLKARALVADGELDAALQELAVAVAADPDSVYLRVARASIYLQQGDITQAYQLLSTVLELEPEDIEAQLLLAELLYQRNDSNDRVRALVMLHHILDLHPQREELGLQLSQLHVLDQDYAQARAVVQKVLNLYPDSIPALLQQAKIYVLQAENNQAETIYRRIISMEPQSRRAYVYLGQLLIQDKQTDAALRLYLSAAQQTDDPVYFNHLRASLLAKTNQYDAALLMLNQLLLEDPQDYQAMFKIGLVHLQQQQWQAAEKFLARSVALKPLSQTYYWLGHAMEQQQKFTSSLAVYRQVVEPEFLHYAALERVGAVYAQLGDYSQASATIEELLRGANAGSADTEGMDADIAGINWSPQPFLYLQLALYYDAQNKPQQVLHALQRGIEKYPQSDELYYACGVYYSQQGKQQLMEQNMRSTIAINKDHAGALNYLAYTYAETGEHLEEALDFAQRAVAIDVNGAYVDTLGWVYYKLGKLGAAREQLELALNLSQQDPLIKEHLGDVYAALNLAELARNIYTELLKKKPENKVLQDKLKELNK
jgi:tetratricopeptide (TPR) repeat protein